MIHRISQNIGVNKLDYDVTASGNGATYNFSGDIVFTFAIVATTAALDGFQAQVEVSPDGTTWTNLGANTLFGGSLTGSIQLIDVLPSDAANAVAGAQYARIAYTSVTGTVRADTYVLSEILNAPPTQANTPIFAGHTA